MAEEQKNIRPIFQKIECYTANIAELADEIEDELFEENDTGVVTLDFDAFKGLLQVVWNKVKETAFECENKRIEVKLPSGWVGTLIGAALSAIGFKL